MLGWAQEEAGIGRDRIVDAEGIGIRSREQRSQVASNVLMTLGKKEYIMTAIAATELHLRTRSEVEGAQQHCGNDHCK